MIKTMRSLQLIVWIALLISCASPQPTINNLNDAIAVAQSEVAAAAGTVSIGHADGIISGSQALRLKQRLQRVHDNLKSARLLINVGKDQEAKHVYNNARVVLLKVLDELEKDAY